MVHARVVDDNDVVIFDAFGKDYACGRAARRKAYCQVLDLAASRIIAEVILAFQPSADQEAGLGAEELRHHLCGRRQALQGAAKQRLRHARRRELGLP